jgi:hypothetical protein
VGNNNCFVIQTVLVGKFVHKVDREGLGISFKQANYCYLKSQLNFNYLSY